MRRNFSDNILELLLPTFELMNKPYNSHYFLVITLKTTYCLKAPYEKDAKLRCIIIMLHFFGSSWFGVNTIKVRRYLASAILHHRLVDVKYFQQIKAHMHYIAGTHLVSHFCSIFVPAITSIITIE